MAVIGVVGLAVGLCIQGIVSGWDGCLLHLRLSHRRAAGGGVLLLGAEKGGLLGSGESGPAAPLGRWFYPTAKYLYCGVTVLVLILGAVNGGIG